MFSGLVGPPCDQMCTNIRTRVLCKGQTADTKARYNKSIINTGEKQHGKQERKIKKELNINKYQRKQRQTTNDKQHGPRKNMVNLGLWK